MVYDDVMDEISISTFMYRRSSFSKSSNDGFEEMKVWYASSLSCSHKYS